MANVNKVMLLGRLVQKPELSSSPGGLEVCSFTLAVNRTLVSDGQRKQETSFIDVNVFGKTAKNACALLQKGQEAFVEGRLRQHRWADKKTGAPRSKIDVLCETFQAIAKPEGNPVETQASLPLSQSQQDNNNAYAGYVNDNEEDIGF